MAISSKKLLDLPEELIIGVLRHCTLGSWNTVSKVCTQLQRIAQDEILLKEQLKYRGLEYTGKNDKKRLIKHIKSYCLYFLNSPLTEDILIQNGIPRKGNSCQIYDQINDILTLDKIKEIIQDIHFGINFCDSEPPSVYNPSRESQFNHLKENSKKWIQGMQYSGEWLYFHTEPSEETIKALISLRCIGKSIASDALIALAINQLKSKERKIDLLEQAIFFGRSNFLIERILEKYEIRPLHILMLFTVNLVLRKDLLALFIEEIKVPLIPGTLSIALEKSLDEDLILKLIKKTDVITSECLEEAKRQNCSSRVIDALSNRNLSAITSESKL